MIRTCANGGDISFGLLILPLRWQNKQTKARFVTVPALLWQAVALPKVAFFAGTNPLNADLDLKGATLAEYATIAILPLMIDLLLLYPREILNLI